MTRPPGTPAWEWTLLLLILVLAVVLRVYRLGSVPPGFTHDEAGNGHDAAAVMRGLRPIYFTGGYGREPLYVYSVALMMSVLGPTGVALRLTTVAWGLIVILLSYAFTRRLFGSLTALLTAAWMAISFWCLMTSRVGLRAITSTAVFAASAYSFWRAYDLLSSNPSPARGRTWLWWGLSGLLLGVSLYTYMASRAMPAVYLLFLGYLSMRHVLGLRSGHTSSHNPVAHPIGDQESGGSLPSMSVPGGSLPAPMGSPGGEWGPSLRQLWVGIPALLLIAALVAAPLLHYLVAHPGAEERIGQLNAPLRDALGGDFAPLLDRVARSLATFTFQGDPHWLYNIAGRPLFDLAGGAFFYAGFLILLWYLHDPRYAFLLLWLLVGVTPALITGPEATTLRAVTAQPAVFVTASLGLATIIGFLHRHTLGWGRVVIGGAVATLFAITGVRTTHAYFDVWAHHRDVRVAYHHALVQQAHYLDESPETGVVSLSSIYPGRVHDPYTMELSLHREDLSLRWFDGRFALVFPNPGESRVIIPSIAQLDEALEPFIEAHGSLVHTREFRPDDLVTGFAVYRFDGESALEALMPTMRDNPVSWSPSDVFPDEDPSSVYEPLELPVDFDGVLSLIGYDLRSPRVAPGEEVELLTVWHIHDSFTAEAVAFTHVLRHDGQIIGQLDRLDVPSWQWHPDDVFVQLHRFSIDGNTPPGVYPVALGLYTREDSRRLPVVTGDVPIDDRVLLRPVEVAAE